MTDKKLCFKVLERPVEIRISDTGSGLNILITGGDKPHIGAVSVKSPGRALETVLFPSHKDNVISDKWAVTFSEKYNAAAAVSCGIHYDNISKDEIKEVVKRMDEILEELTGKGQGI